MSETPLKVIYVKPSKMGTGSVPVGAKGTVIKYVSHPITTKLLVDFVPGGMAIVPLSAVKQ